MTNMREWKPGTVVSQQNHPGGTWLRIVLLKDGQNRSFTERDLCRDGTTAETTVVGSAIFMRGDDAVSIHPQPNEALAKT